jgi:hypothetical protein
MKTNFALPIIAVIAFGISFSSCKKTSDTAETSSQEIATTTDLSSRQAISDNITEDANNQFLSAASTQGVMGARPTSPTCANISLNPVTPGTIFPKILVIDFGTGCLDANNITRSGKINVVISGLVRDSGSKATMTFTNYVVNGYGLDGTVTWTNTSKSGTKSWTRIVTNGKTTSTIDGVYWLYSGTRYVVQTSGVNTPLNLADDTLSITGTHNVTNMYGRTRTCTIDDSNPLIKATVCPFISKGSMKLQGPLHYATIDFGDGTCDNQATFSIDGGTSVAFTLH